MSLLLPALLMSGWGSVVAAAFCAHDGGQPSAMAKNHACCRAKLQQQREHCGADSSTSSAHEAMAMDEMALMSPAADETKGAAVALSRLDDICLHCVSRSNFPTTFAVPREPEQKQRDLNIALPRAKIGRAHV